MNVKNWTSLQACSLLLVLIAALASSGCADDNPTFSILPSSQTFHQSASELRSKVDILWVMDNSGSMETSQENVANNFEAFIQDFQSRNYDYRMAVTVSDAWLSWYYNDPSYSAFRDGTNETSHTGVFVIDPLTPNIQDTFITNIIQGIRGYGDERAFHSMRETLNNTTNPDFLREDSFLAVIIVSDEDDFSQDSANFSEDYNNPQLHPVQDYVDYLDELTGSTEANRRYSVSAMAIFDEACRVSLNNEFSGRKIGHRYADLVDATAGVKGSLCEDFAETLGFISERILELATQFHLNREPIESTIRVIINGSEIPKSADNAGPTRGGWTYIADTNSIMFTGDHIPEAGSEIRVLFDPVELEF